MIFYVNEVDLPKISDGHHKCIGLFDSCKWVGEGYFCGWYGAEFYLNTNLLAYGIQIDIHHYDPKLPFDGGFFENVNQHFDKIRIGCGMWTRSFEAESIEDAVRIFKTQSWE